MTPTLTTERLVLVPYRASMVTYQHVAWLNDRENMRYSEQRHKRHTLESQHEYLNKFPAGSHIWLIRDNRENGGDYGTITAYVDEHNKLADMGIMVDKKYHGFGIAREAWAEVTRFLFGNGISRIECGCRGDNFPMVRLATGLGLTPEAILLDHFWDEELNTGMPKVIFSTGRRT